MFSSPTGTFLQTVSSNTTYNFSNLAINAILALLTLLVLLFGAQFLRRLTHRIVQRTSKNANLPVLLSNLVYIILLSVAVLMVIGIFTGTPQTIVATLGFLGAALSLSLQDIIRNLVAGVFILLEQPFSVGERISVRDVEGRVENIKLRTTEIRTDSGLDISVPNLLVFTEVVTNRSDKHQQRYRVLWLTLTNEKITYDDALPKITEMFVAQNLEESTGKPAWFLNIETVTATETKLRLEFWTAANSKSLNETIVSLNKVLPEVSISVNKPA